MWFLVDSVNAKSSSIQFLSIHILPNSFTGNPCWNVSKEAFFDTINASIWGRQRLCQLSRFTFFFRLCLQKGKAHFYQGFSSLPLMRSRVSQKPNYHSDSVCPYPACFSFFPKLRKKQNSKPMVMYGFHKREEMLTPSRQGMGGTGSALGLRRASSEPAESE